MSEWNEYTASIIAELEKQANPERAAKQRAYLQNQFEHLGLSQPETKKTVKQVESVLGKPTAEDLRIIAEELWAWKYREGSNAAIELLVRNKKKLDSSWLPFLETLITTDSWWETVDGLSVWIVGPVLKKQPELQRQKSAEWLVSGNMWLQRTALIFQNGYKADTDVELLFANIRPLAGESEFFIRKAIGWALRTAGEFFPLEVLEFCNSTELSPLSRKEALRKILSK